MNRTVLIVEDHEAFRRSLREWLSNVFPDCRYLEAKSGEEALSIFSSKKPDVVLMDINLPGMSGIDATRSIKEISPETKVAIITIHDTSEHRKRAKEAGADDFVTKRGLFRELIPLLKTYLSPEK